MTSINFDFLRPKWPPLAALAAFAEQYCHSDPDSALVKLRLFIEQVVENLYSTHALAKPIQASLHDLLNDRTFHETVPGVIIAKLHAVRVAGNKAAHGGGTAPSLALATLREAFEIARWFALTYCDSRLTDLPTYTEPTPGAGDTSKAELKRQKKAALDALEAQRAQVDELLRELQAARDREQQARVAAAAPATRLADARAHAQHTADLLHLSEAATRKRLIDAMLLDAGWDVSDPDRVRLELPIKHQPTTTGEGFADYVLLGDDGVPLAVIEAKRTSEAVEKGRQQAKHYADGLEKTFGRRPIIYYTNGYDITLWNDAEDEPPRRVYGYHDRDTLVYMTARRTLRLPAAQVAPNTAIADRRYQIESIKRVIERFANKHRRALIVQATGTGKTRVAIALADALIRGNWARRVLFLCDRRELAKQANDAFKNFLPSEPRTYFSARTKEDTQCRIYIATYQAMSDLFQSLPVGFFDLIIADESHRSIYNRYRDIFRYFDALQVGLTATPIRYISRNTFGLFGCEDENPTALFTYADAISHNPPYLVPFKVKALTTGFLARGIKYSEMTPAQRQQLEEQEAEPQAIEFEKHQVDKAVLNKDTNRRILRNLMENGIRDASGALVGKSIIFARSHQHAVFLQELFDELYPQYGGRVCRVIDNYEPRAETLIDELKKPDSDLRIAISVDMLDTGIDIPEVVNLVFAKPVYSYVKFWQMIGRGTRLCKDLFGPGQHKTEFLIFDHWENFAFFGEGYVDAEPPSQLALLHRLFLARLNFADQALAKPDLPAFSLAANLLLADIRDLPDNSISVREKWRAVAHCASPERLHNFDAATRATLTQDIAPLMQWRNLPGEDVPAYTFDILIAQAQGHLLRSGVKGPFQGRRDRILDLLSELQTNLNPVRDRAEVLARVKSPDFWDNPSVQDLEDARLQLRGIIRYRRTSGPGTRQPKIIDVAEDPTAIVTTDAPAPIPGLNFLAYRDRVEGVLTRLFATNPTLQRIKAGRPVSPADLQALVSLVLTQDPALDLRTLTEYFPHTAGHLDLAIRSIIGLDPTAVQERFAGFIRKHPTLNSTQLRFLDLLINHIARNGIILIERLYEEPFTHIDAHGFDAIFPNPAQADELLDLIRTFTPPPSPPTPPAANPASSASPKDRTP